MDAEQLHDPGPGAEDLGQRRLEHVEGERAGGGLARRLVGQIEQPVDLAAPAGAGAHRPGDAAAQQILLIGMADQPLGRGGEALGLEVGKAALALVAHHPVDGGLHQLLEVADDVVHGLAARLRLRDGDLLDGVLQLQPGRLQLFDQVGPMQELERRRAVARQPAFQQPPDPIAGVQGIEVVRADAERLQALTRLLHLAPVGFALG